MVLLCLLFIVFVTPFIIPEPKEDPNAWKTEDNTTMAYSMMQQFVKDYLVAPGSAKFAWITDTNCQVDRYDNIYDVKSWVDSQNSFGALLRMQFEGTIEQTDNKLWNLRFLYMDDQRMYMDWAWAKDNNVGDIDIYEFINNFNMQMKHFVSEKADSYVNIDYSANPIDIRTTEIGEYIIKTYFDEDGYVTNFTFSYVGNDTRYQNNMSNKVFSAFVNAIEIYNSEEENQEIIKNIYGNKNDVVMSLIGNKYSKNIDYPNFIYSVELNSEVAE
jgi:hypothetical protein